MNDDRKSPLASLYDVPVRVSVELGRTRIRLSEAAALGPGSVVELGKAAGESLDLRVNGKLVARGEAVVVGEKYGIRIVEVIGAEEDAPPSPAVHEDCDTQEKQETENAA